MNSDMFWRLTSGLLYAAIGLAISILNMHVAIVWIAFAVGVIVDRIDREDRS